MTNEPRLPFFEGNRDGGHDGVEGIFLLIEDLVPRRPRIPNG